MFMQVCRKMGEVVDGVAEEVRVASRWVMTGCNLEARARLGDHDQPPAWARTEANAPGRSPPVALDESYPPVWMKA
jgi:hypothetical protein